MDVDLDADEAVKLAFRFLPATLTGGRESRPHSHCWYVAPGAESADWKDVDGKKLVELRSTGRQTLVAPSMHPDGDEYVWHSEAGLKMAEVTAAELKERCRELATAALIARHVPPEGSRHDYAMALAGFVLRGGRMEDGPRAQAPQGRLARGRSRQHGGAPGPGRHRLGYCGEPGDRRVPSSGVLRWRSTRRASCASCASGGAGSARSRRRTRRRRRNAATRPTGS